MDVDAPDAGSGRRSLRHKTLSAYYPILETLDEYLTSRTGSSPVYHSDPQDYRELLATTICATQQDASPFSSFTIIGSECKQQEVIDRILQELSKRGSRADALILGTKITGATVNTARPAVEVRHAWNPSFVLHEQPWKILRSRLGDNAFKHLFLSTSMFLTLGNNCFVQLCGPPTSELYDHERFTKGPKRTATATPDKPAKKQRESVARSKSNSPASVTINRKRIYYGQPPRTSQGKLMYGLPRTHILNTLKIEPGDVASDAACAKLVRVIFPTLLDPMAGGAIARGSQQRVTTIMGAMRELIHRHSRLNYSSLLRRCLDRMSDVDVAYLGDGGDPGSMTPSVDLAPDLQPVSHSQVCRFISSVLRQLLSSHLAGSEENLAVIVCNARQIVTAKMYEPVTLHTLMQGLRVNDVKWLAVGEGRVSPQESLKRRRLLENFMQWLCDDFIIPLIKASFYATETATTQYETVYYSHGDWERCSEPHLQGLKSALLEEVVTADKGPPQNALGVSAVRLIPKPVGFRPIVNLGRQVTKSGQGVHSKKGKSSVNDALKDLHYILTHEKNRRRDCLGSCLFGTNEIFSPLQSLKNDLIRTHGSLPRLYFVKMDIKAAFDTIMQDKMLEVIDELLAQSDDYTIMQYALLLPPASKASQGSSRRLYKTRATAADSAKNFVGHAASLAATLRNAVAVDLGRNKEVSRADCMKMLREHLKNNIWQIGKKYYRQKTGIPQGSKISSLLCSFFYSWLEKDHLAWTRREGTRLLRYIDDFLLITNDISYARRFVNVMSRGFPAFGAFVSPGKSLINFEMTFKQQVMPVAPIASDGHCYFPYCGFLIDTRTLCFRIDYHRQVNAPTRQSFALRKVRTPGLNFVGWFSRQLENRNHVAYLDTLHNHQSTVLLNVFVNFAFTTMKVPHYFSGTMDQRRSVKLQEWLSAAIEYTFNAGRARVLHAARDDVNKLQHYALQKRDFTFVALSAMRLVLSRKASRFHHVVDLLNRDLSKGRTPMPELQDIVKDGWEIVSRAKY